MLQHRAGLAIEYQEIAAGITREEHTARCRRNPCDDGLFRMKAPAYGAGCAVHRDHPTTRTRVGLDGAPQFMLAGFVFDRRGRDRHAPVDRAGDECVVQRVQRRTVPFNSTAESRANVNACSARRYAFILDRRNRHVKQDFARIAVYGLYITVLTRERGKIADFAVPVEHRSTGEIQVAGIVRYELMPPFQGA